VATNAYDPTPSPASPRPPITYESLLTFPRDPLRCMRRLLREHGTISALEEAGKRLVFVFGPDYTQQVLRDPKI
jgi:cytochrome P450